MLHKSMTSLPPVDSKNLLIICPVPTCCSESSQVRRQVGPRRVVDDFKHRLLSASSSHGSQRWKRQPWRSRNMRKRWVYAILLPAKTCVTPWSLDRIGVREGTRRCTIRLEGMNGGGGVWYGRSRRVWLGRIMGGI